jgi:hypothetical protein
MDQTIPRRRPLKTQPPLTPSKVSQKVSDKKIARQRRLEEKRDQVGEELYSQACDVE